MKSNMIRCCLLAFVALFVGVSNARANTGSVDCLSVYLAAIASADQFEHDCLNANPNGPVPCMDWPECCTADAQSLRNKAWENYLTCIGVLPPAENPVPYPGTDCMAIYLATVDQILANMMGCMGTGSVPISWCLSEAQRLINEAGQRLADCVGGVENPPAENAAHNEQDWTMSQFEVNVLVGLVEGVPANQASTALMDYNPCTDPTPGYQDYVDLPSHATPQCGSFRYHDVDCLGQAEAEYWACLAGHEATARYELCECWALLFDPPAYQACKAAAMSKRNTAFNACWSTYVIEANKCCKDIVPPNPN